MSGWIHITFKATSCARREERTRLHLTQLRNIQISCDDLLGCGSCFFNTLPKSQGMNHINEGILLLTTAELQDNHQKSYSIRRKDRISNHLGSEHRNQLISLYACPERGKLISLLSMWNEGISGRHFPIKTRALLGRINSFWFHYKTLGPGPPAQKRHWLMNTFHSFLYISSSAFPTAGDHTVGSLTIKMATFTSLLMKQ